MGVSFGWFFISQVLSPASPYLGRDEAVLRKYSASKRDGKSDERNELETKEARPVYLEKKSSEIEKWLAYS